MYDEERRRELDEEDRYADFLEAQEREQEDIEVYVGRSGK